MKWVYLSRLRKERRNNEEDEEQHDRESEKTRQREIAWVSKKWFWEEEKKSEHMYIVTYVCEVWGYIKNR